MAIYLDYSASMPILPEVLEKMVDVYQNVPGNPDSRTSIHGNNARKIVEDSRKAVADLAGVNPSEVFFTSGATESINIAIQGLEEYAAKTHKKHIVSSTIEHKAVLETLKAMEHRGYEVEYVNPGPDGRVEVPEIEKRLRPDTLLVCLMHVNNETGMVQPVKELGEILENRDIHYLVDATQSFGKMVSEIRNLKYSMLAASAHKFGGPQGIGILILRRNRQVLPPVKPVYFGGGQESGIRPGTVPTALCAGIGEACKMAKMDSDSHEQKNKNLLDLLLRQLERSGVSYQINGKEENLAGNCINLQFPGVSSEALMIALREKGSLSNGSACTSHSYAPSYVLSAMGMNEEEIQNSVRISWNYDVEPTDFSRFLSILINYVAEWQ